MAEEPAKKSALEKRLKFLEVLSQSCNVTKACEISGLDRSDVYKVRKDDEAFAAAWDAAKELGVEALEDEMHRRAFDGVLKVSKHGQFREYSDTLAIFLAKAHKPEKYSERIRNEISGPGGQPLANMDDDKVAKKLNAILSAVMKRKAAADNPEQDTGANEFDDLA